jgi:hypothetical protein
MQPMFGQARELYQRGVHPRLLLDQQDLQALRRLTAKGDGKLILLGLRRLAKPMFKYLGDGSTLDALIAENLAKPQQCYLYAVLVRFWDLAALAVLDENPKQIAILAKLLGKIAALPINAGLTPGWPIHYGLMVGYDLLHPHLDAETRLAIVRRADAMADHLLQHLRANRFLMHAGGNKGVGGVMNSWFAILGIAGDPGAKDRQADLPELCTLLAGCLHAAIGRDGYPTEDIGYGSSVAAGLALTTSLVQRAGHYDGTTDCPRLLKVGQALLHFMQPWGEHLTNTGDHSDDLDSREYIFSYLAAINGDPTLSWLVEQLRYPPVPANKDKAGKPFWLEVPLAPGRRRPASLMSLLGLRFHAKPQPPDKRGIATQFCDRDRGIVAVRGCWDPLSTFAVFDGSQRSPGCAGHHHDSSGNFTLSALGEYFAIDCGRYCLEQNQHNLVLINGKSGRSTGGEWSCNYNPGRLTRFEPNPFCDFASADSSTQHDCYWAWRSFGLVKCEAVPPHAGDCPPTYAWLVDDLNLANDWGEYWWTLNTAPENRITIKGDQATITGSRHGHHLDLHFILPQEGYPKPHTLALAQDINRLSSTNYIKDPEARAREFADRPREMVHYSVFTRPRLIAKVAGYNGRFMSLLLPRPKGDSRCQVTQLPSLVNSLAVRLRFAAVEDIIIYAYEHQLLEAADIRGRGTWCVVRRRLSDGQILAWTMGDGSSLSIGGKAVPVSPRWPKSRQPGR